MENIKILIVDDISHLSKTIKLMLQSFNAHPSYISEVNGGKGASRFLDANDYSLVFMDISMPILMV